MVPLLFYALIIAIFVISFRVNKNETFLDKNSTNTIKGLFVILIIFSHILNYFPYTENDFFSKVLGIFVGAPGQLVVTMFFFVSGYGIAFSIINKGSQYSKTILTNRFLRIIIYAVVSLIPFFIYNAIIGKTFEIQDYFLAIIGLKSFGNASWFLFAILVCYFVTGIIYLFNYKNNILPFLIISVCLLVYAVLGSFLMKDFQYKFDTILAYPIGLFTMLFSKKILALLKNKRIALFFSALFLLLTIGGRIIMQTPLENEYSHVFLMLFCNLSLCMFFTSLTRAIVFKSLVLEYFGKCSFAMFIIHLLAVRLFVDIIHIDNQSLNYLAVFSASIAIGIPFYYIYHLLDRFVVNPIVILNKKMIRTSVDDIS